MAVSANAAAINPQWSPDGRQIVFATVFDPPGTPGNMGVAPGTPANSAARPSQADIWVMNADGTGRTNLTRSRFLNVQPTWGRDGSVYFVSDRAQGGLENIWSIRTSAPGAMLPAAAVAPARQTNIGVTAEVPTP